MAKKKPKRGRPFLPKGEARTERFWFRVSLVELRRLAAAAKKAGQDVGTWARDLLLKQCDG